MAIEPEIIPINSNEGIGAKHLYPKITVMALILAGFIFLIILLKTIFSLTLMTIGLIFIFQKVRKQFFPNR
ncbi:MULTISPECIES: hypothetical protein [Prochlorococcus]|uniref:hypothetical protein n=1 Tax=Prochlorococcus TaxID=1218 RepID=UPI0005339BFC|nr:MULTISPECIES: hypothetical protein [Prochlorococcus]KGG12167.1 hypothetical protein EV05_1372 [Prochlorococcus sp. MIT 0601]